MKYKQWLKAFAPVVTDKGKGKGKRFKLCFYVYPAGHGNLFHINKKGKVPKDNAPVKNVDKALEIIKDLWKIAAGPRNSTSSKAST
jgi:hypothetical protein